MHLPKIKYLILAALAAFQFDAQASLLSPLEYTGGGHTWLKLSETAGLSLNDFSAGAGGWNTKYRLASDSEIDALVAGFGLPADSGYARRVPGVAAFFNELGGMTPAGMTGTWFSDGNAGAIGQGLDRYVSVQITNGDAGFALGADCPAYFVCQRSLILTDKRPLGLTDGRTGLFLVRADAADVPEPSSLALVLGAGALLGMRRRRPR